PRPQEKGPPFFEKEKKHRPSETKCPFRIIAQEQAVGWRGYELEELHNNDPFDNSIAHPPYRTKKLDANLESKALFFDFPEATNTSLYNLSTTREIYNIGQKIRSQELGVKTPINWLVDKLGNRKFFHQKDAIFNNRVTRLFFANQGRIKFLEESPDVILVDSTYQTNRFNIPIVDNCGSSRGSKTPQFAVGFLNGEKKDD
ncbi:hypothetical protein GcC1_148027, partial [Golovinomyces cichoracearum]